MKQFFCVLPGLIGCGIIKRFGLSGSVAVLGIEVLLLALRRDGRQHDGRMLLFSTLGIGVGYILYPATSFPPALAMGSLLLTMIIHAAMFLILSGFLKDK